MSRFALIAAFWAAALPAAAAPGPSEVYEAPGLGREAITRRALVCIPKFATSGLTTAPTIISSDPEAGFVQAHNVFKAVGFAVPTSRSTITFEAKDGRFRISHGDLAVMIGARWADANHPSKGTISHLRGQSFQIANCIQQGPVSDDF